MLETGGRAPAAGHEGKPARQAATAVPDGAPAAYLLRTRLRDQTVDLQPELEMLAARRPQVPDLSWKAPRRRRGVTPLGKTQARHICSQCEKGFPAWASMVEIEFPRRTHLSGFAIQGVPAEWPKRSIAI